jgi:hypothetical protein
LDVITGNAVVDPGERKVKPAPPVQVFPEEKKKRSVIPFDDDLQCGKRALVYIFQTEIGKSIRNSKPRKRT